MTETPGTEEMHKALFANLIMMLASSVMQQMGKTVNPMTGKAEVDLQTARMTIDMIVMLQAKTKGNCDETEDAMLKDLLSSLQMNFVETSEQENNKKTESSDAPETNKINKAANTRKRFLRENAIRSRSGKALPINCAVPGAKSWSAGNSSRILSPSSRTSTP